MHLTSSLPSELIRTGVRTPPGFADTSFFLCFMLYPPRDWVLRKKKKTTQNSSHSVLLLPVAPLRACNSREGLTFKTKTSFSIKYHNFMATTELWDPTLLLVIPLCQFSSNFHFLVTVWHHRKHISEEIAVLRSSWHESVLATLLTFYPCHRILFLSIQRVQCSQATKACSLCRVPPTEMKKEMDPDYDKEMHLFHLCVGQVCYGICVEAGGQPCM